MSDIVIHIFVQCFYTVIDILCRELMSEMVPYTNLMFYISIESGAIVLHSPGGDILFTVMDDDAGEVFCHCVGVNEDVYAVGCEGCIYVVGEGVPVCSLVAGESAPIVTYIHVTLASRHTQVNTSNAKTLPKYSISQKKFAY